MGNTLKDVSTFSVLMLLFIFIYSLLGMEFFAYKVKFNPETNALDLSDNGRFPDSNFNNLLQAFLSVFIVLANDGWSTIYFDHYRAMGGMLATFYFIPLLVMGQKILLNLFVAIIL
jgi:voltage-dependent calcium channel L type alpha-1D